MSIYLLAGYFIALGYSILICFKCRKGHEYPIAYFWLYLILTLIVDIAAEILDRFGFSFQYLYILFAPIEFYFIATIYYVETRRRFWRNSILAFIPTYLAICLFYLCYVDSATHYHIFNLRGALIIGMILVYFDELYKETDFADLTANPVFWVSIGNLFFWAGNFFVVGLVTPLKSRDPKLAELVYSINPVLNIFLYIMFAQALKCSRKTYLS